MNAPSRLSRRRSGPFTPGLKAGLVAGVALNLAGLACIGATWRLPAPPAPARTFVTVSPDSARAREFAELLDPSPLFLPTPLNHGSGQARVDNGAPEEPPLPDTQRAPAATAPHLAAAQPVAPVLTPEGVPGASVADTLLASGLRAPAALAPGRPRCEIASEDGARAPATLAIDLERDARSLPPAEFLVEIDAYGAQPPTLLSGTGDAALDLALNAALTRALREKTLAAGRYRVTLAP